jgi:hypothetical protein
MKKHIFYLIIYNHIEIKLINIFKLINKQKSKEYNKNYNDLNYFIF